MQDVIWSGRPKLRKPVMVCAFKGWNDAGEAASAAVAFIRESFEAEDVASIDPEEFFDFTAVRPTVRLTEGLTREIDWPTATVCSSRPPRYAWCPERVQGARRSSVRNGSSARKASSRARTSGSYTSRARCSRKPSSSSRSR